MTRLLNLIKKRFTIGFLLSIATSFVFAVLLRYMYQCNFDIDPVRGGFSEFDLSYFAIVALSRFIFSVLLETYLGDKFSLPAVDALFKPDINQLMVNEQNPQSSHGNNSKSSSANTSGKLSLFESNALSSSMQDNTQEQLGLVSRLENIKTTKGVRFFSPKGDLYIDIPFNMSHQEASDVSKEVQSIDRQLNAKFDEYEKLKKKDVELNNSKGHDRFKDALKRNRSDYNKLFEKEN